MSETTSRLVEARFKVPRVSDWDRHRSLIERLYKVEGRCLREVITILREREGFQATPRQFKQRITSWNLHKNHKVGEVEDLLQQYTKDELENALQQGGVDSLVVEGKRLSHSLVKRVLRQRRQSETSTACSTSSSTWSRPEELESSSLSTLSKTPPLLQDVPPAQGEKPLIVEPPLSPSWISTPSTWTRPCAYPVSHESGSLEIPSTLSSSVSEEPSTAEKSYYEDDEWEGETSRKRRKMSVRTLASSSEVKALACPFYKHNPRRYNPQNGDAESSMRYRTCAGPGWESISRLRQHLFRAHIASKQCETCDSVLHSRSDFENHARNCGGSMARQVLSDPETISAKQWYHLKRKQLPGLTKEQSWTRMYRILFPEDNNSPSPYYQSDNENSTDTFTSSSLAQVDSLIQHLYENLPQKIMTRWQGEPKSQGKSLSSQVSDGQAVEVSAASIRRSPLRVHSEQSTAVDRKDESPAPAPAQVLKKLISDSVAETCNEWFCNRKEEGNDSDHEESDGDIAPAGYVSTSADREAVPPAVINTFPSHWDWNSETQRDQTSAIYADLNTLQSNFFLQSPPYPIFTPTPPFDLCSYMDSVSSSTLDSTFNLSSAMPLDTDVGLWPLGIESQSFHQGLYPATAQSGSLQDAVNSAYPDTFAHFPLQHSTEQSPWEQSQLPSEIAKTLPESNEQS